MKWMKHIPLFLFMMIMRCRVYSSKLISGLVLAILCLISTSTKATDYFWVNGAGNWSDYGTHWATTSGGLLFHTTIPSPNDNVYFDANSFSSLSDTLMLDATIINCATMDWSAVTNTPVVSCQNYFAPSISVYGSLIMSNAMVWNVSTSIYMKSDAAGNSINTNGLNLALPLQSLAIIIEGAGTFDLLNDLSAVFLSVNNGIFNSGGYTLNADISVYTDGVNIPEAHFGSSVINGTFGCNTLVEAGSTLINGNLSSQVQNTFNDVTGFGFIYSDRCNFHNVECMTISGDSNQFNRVQFADMNCPYRWMVDCNSLSGKGNAIHQMIIPGTVLKLWGSQVVDSLECTSPGQVIEFYHDSLTVNMYLGLDGDCNGLTSVLAPYDTAEIILNAINGSFNFLRLQQIRFTSATVCTAVNSFDEGGNSGVTITEPAYRKLYWVGDGGKWNDTTHWSLSSGGPGGACIPTRNDSVFFDAASFTIAGDTVLATGPFMHCRTLDASGVMNAPVFYNEDVNNDIDWSVYGSMMLNPIINWNIRGEIKLHSDLPGNLLDLSVSSAGTGYYVPSYTISGAGSWDLLNDIKAGYLTIKEGTFRTNGYTLDAYTKIESEGTATEIYLGTSLIKNSWQVMDSVNMFIDTDSASWDCTTFYSAYAANYENLNCNAVEGYGCIFDSLVCSSFGGNNNTVHFLNTSGNSVSLFGRNNNFGKVEVDAEQVSMGYFLRPALLHFDTLFFAPTVRTISVEDSSFLYFNNSIQMNGSCDRMLSVQSNGVAHLRKTGSSVTFSDLVLRNINTGGGALFTALNSIDDGGNTGINIQSPVSRNLYWVGGTGNWYDANHWSVSSGGAGGACVPNKLDNVFFDVNSFSTAGDTVFSEFETTVCHDMNWSGVQHFPTWKKYGDSFSCYGSLVLDQNMQLIFDASLRFMSDAPGNIINTNGISITSTNPWATVYFGGTGSWDLANDFNADIIYFRDGTVRTNNHAVTCGNSTLDFNWNGNPKIYLGTSIFHAYGDIEWYKLNDNIHADSSTIFAYRLITRNGAVQYNYVRCETAVYSDSCNYAYCETNGVAGNENNFAEIRFQDYCNIFGYNNTYSKVVLNTSCNIEGFNTFDTLIFNQPGQSVVLSDTVAVNDVLQIYSSAAQPTSLTGQAISNVLSLPAGTVCTDYIYLQNIQATGGATFNAGVNSVDLGNNSGWNWSSCAPDTGNVWPGDVNYDLTSNLLDLLYIGIAYGQNGPTRPGATNNWTAQPAINWPYAFSNSANLHHADCDGSGTVDDLDTIAIVQNFGLTHPNRPALPLSVMGNGTSLYFDVPPGPVAPSTNVTVPIMLGTAGFPMNELYGIALAVNYDNSQIIPGTINIDFSNSWMGNAASSLSMIRHDQINHVISFGWVRNDQQNISGYGEIARLSFTTQATATGNYNLGFDAISALDKSEFLIPVNPVSIGTFSATGETLNDQMVEVYPNPATDVLYLNDPFHLLTGMVIVDPAGKICITQYSGDVNTVFDLSKLIPGIYFLKMQTAQGVMSKKITIIRP